jgi:tetratricopeptide (TPR) repeat protein
LIEHAVAVNPLSSVIQQAYGTILYFASRYPEAETRFKRAIELEPENQFAHLFLAYVKEQQGKADEAIALVETPVFRSWAVLARAKASAGRRSEAIELMKPWATQMPSDPYDLAVAYFILGDKERGIDRMVETVSRYPTPPGALGKIRSRTGRVSFRPASPGSNRALENTGRFRTVSRTDEHQRASNRAHEDQK